MSKNEIHLKQLCCWGFPLWYGEWCFERRFCRYEEIIIDHV